jgi:uncharacterized RDD family membrane protein YckC
MLDTTVAIETPEHVLFHYRLAGPVQRWIAHLLDLLLLAVMLVGLAVLVAMAGTVLGVGPDAGQLKAHKELSGTATGILLLIVFFAQWCYFACLEAWKGTTPGKAALGLRVVTLEGRPITFSSAALRNLLRAADALPLTQFMGAIAPAGLFSMLATERNQRVGDLVAGTMVVKKTERSNQGGVLVWPPPEPQELAHIPDDPHLSAEERTAIELFLRRKRRLGPARERELAEIVRPLLQQKLGFTHHDPGRALGLLYHQAVSAGRKDAPASSRNISGPPTPPPPGRPHA